MQSEKELFHGEERGLVVKIRSDTNVSSLYDRVVQVTKFYDFIHNTPEREPGTLMESK